VVVVKLTAVKIYKIVKCGNSVVLCAEPRAARLIRLCIAAAAAPRGGVRLTFIECVILSLGKAAIAQLLGIWS